MFEAIGILAGLVLSFIFGLVFGLQRTRAVMLEVSEELRHTKQRLREVLGGRIPSVLSEPIIDVDED